LTFTSATGTNLSLSGLTSLAGLTFTNATGTGQFNIATTTVTGGFFQTGMGDCDVSSSTLQYDVTTGKFSCFSRPRMSNTQIYTVSSTWLKPVTSTGFTGIYVWCAGGGGGGGGAGTAGNIGGGGGGGGASYRFIASSTLASTSSVQVTVGVAGTKGAAGNNNGAAGGTSSFGNFITCTGGAGGNASNGAASVAAGGVGSGGDVNGTGRDGREPGAYTDSYRGIGGAAGADQGDTGDLANANTHAIGPDGILGVLAGAGGPRPGEWDANSRAGSSGASFGGGGSGGQKVGAGADMAGGDGKQGAVQIIELYN